MIDVKFFACYVNHRLASKRFQDARDSFRCLNTALCRQIWKLLARHGTENLEYPARFVALNSEQNNEKKNRRRNCEDEWQNCIGIKIES